MSIRSKLALAPLVFLFASCNMTWQGQSANVPPELAERGFKDTAYLARQYDTETYFRHMRQRIDGRSNAFSSGMAAIRDTIDRHFFNYTAGDPYTNYGSTLSSGERLGRAVIVPFSAVGMIMPR
jgi:hypothetical protein